MATHLTHLAPPETEPEVVVPPAPPQDDPKQYGGKVAFFQYATVGVFLFLISGFWDLQVQSADYYGERANQNKIKSVPVLAPRGRILDREGRVIVDNKASFSLILNRENFNPVHLPVIARGLNLDPHDLEQRIRRFTRPKYVPLVLKEELTPAELAFVWAHNDAKTFPELELIHANRRLYPKNGFAAHLVGYVGEVSEDELNTVAMAKYEQGDIVGKAGIEKQYNDHLRGEDGQRRVVVDNFGNEREVMTNKEAVPGKDLTLTVDLDLQAVAELAMENKRGGVVALDPRTGEVLALVSRPSYDPNKFTVRILSKDWKEIVNDPFTPMLNRAIQAQLAPGSTFKPIVALAGLETGVLTEGFKVNCGGGASFYGRWFKCHKRGGHGSVDLKKAIAQSCDVFFYTLGNRLGIGKIADYATMAGIGSRTGIDLPQEAAGVMPTPERKRQLSREKWYAGETISVAIGQGDVQVSPLQLAYAMGGLATGGVWQRPHLVREARDEGSTHRHNLQVENVLKIIDGLYAVVNEGGTGGGSRLPGISMSGKTGTAQLASNTLLKGTALGRTMKDNAWFFGFAPRESPEIIVAALYESGEHGNWAAPIVRDIIKAHYDKKARQKVAPALITGGPASLTTQVRPVSLTQ